MRKSTSILFRLFRATAGYELSEYALIAVFISVAALAIIPGSWGKIEEIFKTKECAAKNQDIRVAEPGSPERFQCVARQSGR